MVVVVMVRVLVPVGVRAQVLAASSRGQHAVPCHGGGATARAVPRVQGEAPSAPLRPGLTGQNGAGVCASLQVSSSTPKGADVRASFR